MDEFENTRRIRESDPNLLHRLARQRTPPILHLAAPRLKSPLQLPSTIRQIRRREIQNHRQPPKKRGIPNPGGPSMLRGFGKESKHTRNGSVIAKMPECVQEMQSARRSRTCDVSMKLRLRRFPPPFRLDRKQMLPSLDDLFVNDVLPALLLLRQRVHQLQHDLFADRAKRSGPRIALQ